MGVPLRVGLETQKTKCTVVYSGVHVNKATHKNGFANLRAGRIASTTAGEAILWEYFEKGLSDLDNSLDCHFSTGKACPNIESKLGNSSEGTAFKLSPREARKRPERVKRST